MVIRALAFALAVLGASAASAQCRLALALALDVSSSVDAREYQLQNEGLARALEDPEVREAFLPRLPPVALAIYEWSNARHQAIIQDWLLITQPSDLDRVAAALRTHQRTASENPTAIGNALLFGLALFNQAPICAARTLDLSGDGINNDGMTPRRAYRQPGWEAVTVNGLAIGQSEQMTIYYRRQLIRGHSAFVEKASDFEAFEAAMRRKLIREILPDMMLGQMR